MKNALKKIIVGLFSLLLVLGVFASAGLADEKLFVIDDVDFDDPYAPGDVIPVEITLENLAENDDVEDITVKVWIEDDEEDRITDYAKHNIKRIHQDDDKEFTVYVSIPIDAVEDDYTLHVTAEGEWNGKIDVSDEVIAILEIEQLEHSLHISNVQLSTDNIISGETLDVAIKVANIGEEDESNVKIKVEIPEIGAEKTVSLLNTIGAGYDYTAYLTFEVPEAKAGIYTLVAKAYNADAGATYGQDVMVELVQVVVDKNVEPTKVSTTSAITQTIAAGKGSIFSIEVRNNANVAKTFDLAVGGAANWATTRVDPAQLTLGPGEAEITYAHVLPTESGQHAFTLFVKDNGAVIAANQISVNVAGGLMNPESSGDMNNIFTFLLVVFIVVVAGYLYKKENGDKKSKQVYY